MKLCLAKIKLPRLNAGSPDTTGSKYHARREDGYDSAREARRASVLKVMEKAGLIHNLREQVSYELIPPQRNDEGRLIERGCRYVADFVYEDSAGRTVVEDCKGFRTRDYVMKRKLMLEKYGIELLET